VRPPAEARPTPPTADSVAKTKLAVRGVGKSFVRRGADEAQRVEILRNVDLDVQPNEFVSIIGGSGSGKTTLLRILAGLIPADEGVVSLDGTTIKGPGRERAMNKRRAERRGRGRGRGGFQDGAPG